jgi:hypothetical protein
LKNILPAHEELNWQVLEKIDPWGEKRADYRAAVICLTIATCITSSKGRKPKLSDFMKLFEFVNDKQKDDDSFLERIK